MFTGFFSRNTRQAFARRAALLGIGLGLTVGAFLSPAVAAPMLLVDSNGKLTGADGVDIGGILYDVRFVDGTCSALFSGCDATSDFDFTTGAAADAAARALLSQVFVDGPAGNFDSTPRSTLGCVDASECNALIPFEIVGTPATLTVIAALNTTSLGAEDFVVSRRTTPFTSSQRNGGVFAMWSLPPTSPVPLPATLPLIGLGLGAAALVARRKRSSHQPTTA